MAKRTKYDWRFIPIPSRDTKWMRFLRKIPWVKWGYAYWTPPKPSVMSERGLSDSRGMSRQTITVKGRVMTIK